LICLASHQSRAPPTIGSTDALQRCACLQRQDRMNSTHASSNPTGAGPLSRPSTAQLAAGPSCLAGYSDGVLKTLIIINRSSSLQGRLLPVVDRLIRHIGSQPLKSPPIFHSPGPSTIDKGLHTSTSRRRQIPSPLARRRSRVPSVSPVLSQACAAGSRLGPPMQPR
jgi:hypothetical protein